MVLVEEGDCFLAAEEMDNFLLSVCERGGGTGESFWVGKQGNRKEVNSVGLEARGRRRSLAHCQDCENASGPLCPE